jgi:hypothetical protein
LHRHVVAGKGHHAGAELNVQGVQRGAGQDGGVVSGQAVLLKGITMPKRRPVPVVFGSALAVRFT